MMYIPGEHNFKYQPPGYSTVQDVAQYIMETKPKIKAMGLDAIWLTPVYEGDKISVMISSSDKNQFDTAIKRFAPHRPTKHYAAIDALKASIPKVTPM